MNTSTMRFHTSRRYPLHYQENSKDPLNILVKHKPVSTKSVEIYPPIYCDGLNLVPTPPGLNHQTQYQSIIYAFYSLPTCKTHSSIGPLQKNSSSKECSLCTQIKTYHPTCQASCANANGRSSSQESVHYLHPLQLLSPPLVNLETSIMKDP